MKPNSDKKIINVPLPEIGKIAKAAQEQSKTLAGNIGKAGKAGKEKLQETLSKKPENEGETQEHASIRDTLTGGIGKVGELGASIGNKAGELGVSGITAVSEAGKAGKAKLQDHFSKKDEAELPAEAEVSGRVKLDDQLRMAADAYNATYTIMNDHGSSLYMQRLRAIDMIQNIESLINSISNHPKDFDKDIAEIVVCRESFKQVCEYTRQELEAAQKSAMSAGAGVAGGAAIVSMAPTVAMWVATTFGTASTGTAISALSGAAATNAALAWLGGGALAVGGHGIAGGTALLAMAGPIGWSVSGATLLVSIVLFANKKIKLDKEKKEEIESVMNNTEQIREVDIKIEDLLNRTIQLRDAANDLYNKSLTWYQKDYLAIPEDGQYQLGSLVNQTKALAMLLQEGIETE